jgi:hypothetical protein
MGVARPASVLLCIMKLPLGRWLISLVALFTLVGPYGADWNETHIYNPRWPPHAKFHNAQTMLLGTCLGLLSLYFLWSKRWRERGGLAIGTLLAALYWVTQSGSILFPGTALVDPELVGRIPLVGGLRFNQLAMDAILLVLLGVGYWLEHRRRAAASPLLTA